MNKDLNNLSTKELGKLFPIIISEYNPDWKNMFSAEKQTLERVIGIGNTRRIEHIGSTAVPGLCAKPTIDILVEIKDDTDTDLIIYKLKLLDYHYIPKPENSPPHMMFTKGYLPVQGIPLKINTYWSIQIQNKLNTDLIIPGHDDIVFSRFPKVSGWIVKIGN
jgi:GrpB-like predicted nucleotidyltransferase (UPF0157 family)